MSISYNILYPKDVLITKDEKQSLTLRSSTSRVRCYTVGIVQSSLLHSGPGQRAAASWSREVHHQVPDEPREPSTVSGPRANSPIPTLSTTANGANGAYGSPTSSGVPLPTTSGVPLSRIPTVRLAGWTSGAS